VVYGARARGIAITSFTILFSHTIHFLQEAFLFGQNDERVAFKERKIFSEVMGTR